MAIPPNLPDMLVASYVFVPTGEPPPTEWMAAHPGWVKFPAEWRHRPTAKEGEGPSRQTR